MTTLNTVRKRQS
jgi:hypothetical protein